MHILIKRENTGKEEDQAFWTFHADTLVHCDGDTPLTSGSTVAPSTQTLDLSWADVQTGQRKAAEWLE